VLLRLVLPRTTPRRLIGTLLAAPLALSVAGIGAKAGFADADRAVLAACLDLVKKNQKVRGLPRLEPLKEKAGPAGRLASAQAKALQNEESCVGVVTAGCVHEEGNDNTGTLIQCYGREADAWDACLNTAYKALMASGQDQDILDGLRKAERTWITFRDASCAQYAIVFKGNAAGPMGNQCVMEMTARQALWLEEWLR
jgi:uncharacterized protein YecT (DUF1311 family)